jgi:tetratricopeptide (TPR) repeat protein
MAEDLMFQQAMNAINNGETAHARDLFTRLIKANPKNPEYWLWMSSVVDSSKERIYCLKEVLRLEPQSVAARRGLSMEGVLPPDENLIIPLKAQRRNWETQAMDAFRKAQIGVEKPTFNFKWYQVILMIIGVIGTLTLVAIGVFSIQKLRLPAFTYQWATPTVGPTPTYMPTHTPENWKPTPTLPGVTPLVMFLEQTYTSTPIYINTPHAISEPYKIGLRAFQRGDWTAVITYMQQVTTIEPASPDIHYYIGEAYRMQKNYRDSNNAYKQALLLDKNFAPAYLGLGRLLLEFYPAKWSDAWVQIEKAVAADPGYVDAYYELLQLYIKHKLWEKAATRAETVIVIAPYAPLSYYYRAQVYLHFNQTSLAVQDALKANELDITFLESYRLLAECYIADGRSAEGVEVLNTYLSYMPSDKEALVWLGMGLTANQEYEQANAAFQTALGIDSRNADAYLQRGLMYLAQNDPEKARADFVKAVGYDPRNYNTNFSLGRAFLLLKKPRDSYIQFNIARGFAETDFEKAQIFYWRAQSLEEIGEIESAIKDWKALLELPPTAFPEDWVKTAEEKLAILFTPTRTPVTKSPTITRWPTHTITLTLTRRPTRTITPTLTKRPTLTLTLTRTKRPTLTLTPTRTPRESVTLTQTVTPTPTPTPTK